MLRNSVALSSSDTIQTKFNNYFLSCLTREYKQLDTVLETM